MIETLTLYVNGNVRPVVQPTLEIVLFSSAPRSKVAPGFLALYRSFLKRYKDTFKWYKTNVMKSWKKLDGRGLGQVEQMLTEQKALKSQLLGVEQHSGEGGGQYELPAFEVFSEEDVSDPDDLIHHSFCRLCLPVDETERADDVHAFVVAALANVEFDSGYCGYSYYWHTGDSDAERQLTKVNRGWLMRFPGLGVGDPLTLFSFVDKGILGISWITLISEALLERLGGEQVILDALVKPIEVRRIPQNRGVAIRAGAGPELGDMNRGQKLPLYRAVGQAVDALRVPDEWIENMTVIGMSADEVVEWYGRFFNGAE